MKLRTQLLIAVAVILLLPWAGYRYVLELDASLRENQSRTLAAQARAAAAVISANFPHGESEEEVKQVVVATKTIFADSANSATNIVLDGYADDWPKAKSSSASLVLGDNKLKPVSIANVDAAQVQIRALRRESTLFLFIQVQDSEAVYHNVQRDPLASGDRLLIRVPDPDDENRVRNHVVSPVAPGDVQTRFAGKKVDGVVPINTSPDINAFWEDTTEGYNIEIEMPLPALRSGFGVAVGDVDTQDDESTNVTWTGTFDPADKLDTGTLLYTDPQIEQSVNDALPVCGQLSFFDNERWLLANAQHPCEDSARRTNVSDQNFFEAILQRLFEQFIEYPYSVELDLEPVNGRLTNLPEVTVSVRHARIDEINKIMAIHPVERDGHSAGFVLLEQETDSVRSLTTQALVKLFSLTILVAFATSLSLLIYAVILSWRIGRLRDHTVRALSDKGEVITPPVSRAGDELGELSRGLGSMLSRVQAYTEYQKTLAARLTHELRTPLSVVRTSVEAADSTQDHQLQELLQRARSGSDQLALILQSLSEAHNLESMIADVEFERIDMGEFAQVAAEAYASVYSPRRLIESEVPAESAFVSGNTDLLRQLLDKLVANAVEFSEGEGPVVIAVVAEKDTVTLSVVNTGSELPKDELDLYSPMTSIRESGATESVEEGGVRSPHLGMGLYVAKLIADKHDGKLVAENLDYVVGVQVSLVLSRLE
ncbi:MAG: ATP-binding protein [Pseudomonadota bacterium]